MGSPNASDASGTDTSRKMTKNKHSSTQQPTSQPGSRPLSPGAPSSAPVSFTERYLTTWRTPLTFFLQAGKKRVRNIPGGGAGSASDVDGGAASGGEMSESGKTKKLKLNPPIASSQSGTPQGSRAGSPTAIGNRGFAGSRASSPEGGVPMRGKFLVLFAPFSDGVGF